MKMLTNSIDARNGMPSTRRGKCVKPNTEMRPVTATLDCPVILDITFLKKLDMTSFTKKGLMAISKICGISLIKRTDERKTRKRFKRQSLERVKKNAQRKAMNGESSEEQSYANVTRHKWTAIKQIPKIKISDSSVGRTSLEGGKDAAPAASEKSLSPRTRKKDAKPSVDDIIYGSLKEVVAEPCKTCGRSEQPERFHTHPKRIALGKEKTAKKGVSKAGDCRTKLNEYCTVKEESTQKSPTVTKSIRRYSTGHLISETSSRLVVDDFEASFHSDHEIESIKISHSDGDLRFRLETFNDSKTLHKKLIGKNNVQMNSLKKENATKCSLCGKNLAWKATGTHEMHCSKSVSKIVSEGGNNGEDREILKYITGCYICGEQIAAGRRIDHEEQCIAVWRKQNKQLPPDKRKAEPLRPDYRFTATGEVDFEGTFDSIWANHRDSLVPCNKCGRTFFPGRIEKHEACCSGQPVKSVHKALKNK